MNSLGGQFLLPHQAPEPKANTRRQSASKPRTSNQQKVEPHSKHRSNPPWFNLVNFQSFPPRSEGQDLTYTGLSLGMWPAGRACCSWVIAVILSVIWACETSFLLLFAVALAPGPLSAVVLTVKSL